MTIPKNKRKRKIQGDRKLTTTYIFGVSWGHFRATTTFRCVRESTYYKFGQNSLIFKILPMSYQLTAVSNV